MESQQWQSIQLCDNLSTREEEDSTANRAATNKVRAKKQVKHQGLREESNRQAPHAAIANENNGRIRPSKIRAIRDLSWQSVSFLAFLK